MYVISLEIVRRGHSLADRYGLTSLGRIVDRLFFFQAEDGIRDLTVTGVQTCALPISRGPLAAHDHALAHAGRVGGCAHVVSGAGGPVHSGSPRRRRRVGGAARDPGVVRDRKSTRLNSSHSQISYAVFCLKKKTSEVK